MWRWCILGLALRLALLLYGEWQDRTMEVKYTDVDYFVFHDAAEFVSQGKSPYERATYRYTPLLAFMLQTNMSLQCFGKLLFILFDILTGVLIYTMFTSSGHRPSTAAICACLWIFNPLPMTVSSRGNAESIMSFLVLLTLQLLQQKHVILSAVTYALAVHFKIYPVTFALCIYLLLGKDFCRSENKNKTRFTQLKERPKDDVFVVSDNGSNNNMLTETLLELKPNRNRVVFILIGGTVFGGLTLTFYKWYGWDFLYESYFYHVVRQDTRHNFSPYFYMLYLLGLSGSSAWVKIFTFIPQALLIVSMSVKFYADLPFCCFLITYVFVALNKVCTSQYFLWYLCLVPFLLPTVHISITQTVVLVVLWFLGQGIWLLPAYYLEFEGVNTFMYIWGAGLAFFLIHIYIIYVVVKNYQPVLPHCKLRSPHRAGTSHQS